jgi:hypothetical protein
MTDLFRLILGILASRFKARATLEAENLVLRQQLNVLRRRTPKRPHLNNTDRFLFVWLYRWFPSVLEVVAIVRPETIIRWHRAGFRAYWRWRSRNRVGRPKVSAELRTLIGEMSRANALSARRVFMVSCSSSASRSPSRRSLGTCAATPGHRLRAGGRLSCCGQPSPLTSVLWHRLGRSPREIADALGAAHIGGCGASCACRLHPAQKPQIQPARPRLVPVQSVFASYGSDSAMSRTRRQIL